MNSINVERVFADTNVLAYIFDRTAPEKRRGAKELLKLAADGNVRMIVSTQVCQEFFVTVTKSRKQTLRLAGAKAFITHLSRCSLDAQRTPA